MGKWFYKKIVMLFGCLTEIIFPKPSSCSGCGRPQKTFSRYKLCPACFEKLRMYKENGSMLYDSEVLPMQGVVEHQGVCVKESINANVHEQEYKQVHGQEDMQVQTQVHGQEDMQVQTQVHGQEHTQAHTHPHSHAYDREIVACCYEGIVKEMIYRIKYKDKRDIAITIGAVLADNLKQQNTAFDLIVPVPISRKKLSSRGYNHTSLIARELASLVNIKVFECLIRIKDTKPQVLFNGSDRWYNVKGCFKCIENVQNKRVLLVDDIITTGATAHFCAEALKANGASSVTIIAFAKSTSK
jgi:competence protein ComFC